MRPKVVEIRPFSRSWWAAWLADVKAGRPVGFHGAQAMRGKPRCMALADRPCSMAVAILVAVPVDGPAFAAWSRHYAAGGVALPRPRIAPVVWLPTEWPEAVAA